MMSYLHKAQNVKACHINLYVLNLKIWMVDNSGSRNKETMPNKAQNLYAI